MHLKACVRTVALSSLVLAPGCFGQLLSLEEMRAAIDGVVTMGQARQAVDDVVEISTSFTIGDGVEAIIEEVRAFLESQAPCSTVEIDPGRSLRIDFGELGDACTYRGRTYAGEVLYTFEVSGSDVLVTHEYTDFRSEQVTINGRSDVVWGGGAREVTTDYEIVGTRATLQEHGTRVMRWIDESQGLGGGVRIDGDSRWDGPLGVWDLNIDGVEARGQDPVPQAGAFELVTPRDILATLSFSRIDEDTIEVRLEGPRQERIYHVTRLGTVEDVTDE